jgi:hypothetical protein
MRTGGVEGASQECGEGAGETMSPAGGGRHRANNVA